jgi:hypothetical protein
VRVAKWSSSDVQEIWQFGFTPTWQTHCKQEVKHWGYRGSPLSPGTQIAIHAKRSVNMNHL